MKKFTELEQRILNRIQRDIKITPDPLRDLAGEMNIGANEFLSAVRRLKKDKIIRDISGIFNAEKLGYQSSLVAFEVPKKNLEPASEMINKNPGVSHNYQRDHKYNIWFTISVGPGRKLDSEVQRLAKECNAADFLILRNESMLKIGLNLSVGDETDDSAEVNSIALSEGERTADKKISEEDKKAIRVLQLDLPLAERPFKILAEENNIDIVEKTVCKAGESFKKTGIMRRYAGVLKHQKAGYGSNAMTAWRTDKIKFNDDIIWSFSSVKNISHLYIRTVYPGRWEYPLFAMIHAKTDDELNGIIKNIEKKTGIKDYLVLTTLKEFKKQRIKYFQE